MANKEETKGDVPEVLSQPRNGLPIVAVGASAGGLDAFQAFLQKCPLDMGCAFVVLQHLPPRGESEMVAILSRHTSLPVAEIHDGLAIKPNHVYVLPPGYSLRIAGTAFSTSQLHGKHGSLIIDEFMRSLADQAGPQAIGVVLSGTGTDGTEGIRAIREASGMTLAQSPEEASFDGMPTAAIYSGVVDYIGPAGEMPEQIQAYLHNMPQDSETQGADNTTREQTIADITALLAHSHPNDFGRYKKKTVTRRIHRRMALSHTEDITDYLKLLKNSRPELDQLYQDLLISVTNFFRDPAAFRTLDEQVLAALVDDGDTARPIRVWVPGCATGEEAYTIAILLHERMRKTGKQRDIQIFASDIDQQALSIAREGLYPDSIQYRLSPELIARYFTAEGNYYRIRQSLREQVVFAVQNLITSAPFSRLDLISCRNLLIYLKQDIQSEIMRLFHFALSDGGYLFLGSAESVGRQDQLFISLDRANRLYRRQDVYQRVSPNLPFTAGAASSMSNRPASSKEFPTQPRLSERVQRHLLNHYAPPAVLASRTGEVLHFVGDTVAYLRQPSGQPSHQLFDITRSSIKSQLRSVFRNAVESSNVARSTLIKASRDGIDHPVFLVVSPLIFNNLTLYLITFERPAVQVSPAEEREQPAAGAQTGDDQSHLVQQLEEELSSSRSELLGSIEDLETSNQDLKVANEEAVSMNEELQSTNEELETSKEELQSLNEEVTTVNSELKSKVEQLDLAYSDLDNLLRSISSATLFVSTQNIIRLFTPNCRDLLHLVDTDIGRPLNEIKSRVDDPKLFDDVASTRNSLQTLEQQLKSDDEKWYLRRTAPYQTAGKSIEGVVITYTEVTQLIETGQDLTKSAERLSLQVDESSRQREGKEEMSRQRDAFFELSALPLFVADRDYKFLLLNAAWEQDFGLSLDQLHSLTLPDIIHPEDWRPLIKKLRRLGPNGRLHGIQGRIRGQDGYYHWVEWDIKHGKAGDYFGSGRDISQHVQAADALTTAQDELEKQIHSRSRDAATENQLAHVTLMCIGEAVLSTDTNGNITRMNPVAERLTGYRADTVIGQDAGNVLRLRDDNSKELLPSPVTKTLESRSTIAVADNALLICADGTEVEVEASVSPVFGNKNELLGIVAVFFDVSYSRKLSEAVEHRANHDHLTGLVNRGAFETRLESTLSGARNSNKQHCLLFMDLDRFKIVNDTCGHTAGDELLRQLAREMHTHVRQRDTLARLGGDEFGLILENCPPAESMLIANDILTFISTFRFVWEDKSFQLGISIGIVNIDQNTPTTSELLNNADSACYMAKEAGRNRIHFFDGERLDEQSQKDVMHWASRVTQAIEDDSVQLVAQPIVSIGSNTQPGTHFELLSRLTADNGELIAPSSFLPAAERYNLMPRFDQHVVRKAFAWLAENPDKLKGLSLCSINLSAATLADDRFPALLEDMVKEFNLPPEKICFEITETLAITSLSRTITLAEEFKRQGFMFALDDFGSGFASYHYLKRLPVDFLKIDGEFVKGILTDPVDEAMVRSMNEIGHIMGKKTIAEFVESEAVLEKLKEMGVDYVQGYLTGRPGSLDLV